MVDPRSNEVDQDQNNAAAPAATRLARLTGRSLNRRTLLRGAATATAVTLAGGLLAACGDDEETPAPAPAATATSAAPGGAATATPGGTTSNPTPTTAAAETPTAGAEDDELGAPGGELIYGLSSDPPNMDPHIATGAAAETVKMQIYNSLLRFWIGGEIEPDLAESYEVSDDGLTYTFTLRDGVTWHDGSDFSADDVIASLDRILDQATGASFRSQLSAISDVAGDGNTVTLTLAEPSAPLLTYLAHTNTSILQKAFLDGGGDPNTTSIGTGAFKLDNREPGVRLVLVKNEDYYMEGRPLLDRLTFIPYADENTRMAAIRGGEIHMADYVPWKDMDAFETDPQYKLYTGDAAAFMTVIYNTTQPPFDDERVRYALGFAIDRQAVIDIVFFGRGTPITGGLIAPGNWAHNEALDGHFDYDPDRARELLQEAGVDPSTMSVSLLSTSQYLMHQSTGEVVQANLRDLGINCQLELYDWPTTVDKGNKGEFQFRIHGLGMGLGDPDFIYEFFHSGTPYTNPTGFADDEIDRLLEEARAATTREDRKALYDQAQERIIQTALFSFISYRVQGEVSAAFVKGFHHFPGGLFTNSHKTLEQVSVN
jgi:glutathione transport system substrate-binding protein